MDENKEVRRSLEGFVQLQEGDFISLPKPLDSSFDLVEHGNVTHLKGDKVKATSYKVLKIQRDYIESSLTQKDGRLEIRYFLIPGL